MSLELDRSGEKGSVDPTDHDRDDLYSGIPGGADGPIHANELPGESDRWLRWVVHNSSEIVTIVDPDGTLRYASPAFERVLGYDPKEVVGTMNVLDYVHLDDLPHVLEETEEALSEGGVVSNKAEYRFRHAEGSWRWVESVGTYLLDDSVVAGVLVNSRDITERKEAEEALRRSEAEIFSILESITDGFFALDREWRFTYINSQAGALFSRGREDLIGEKIWEDPTFYPQYRRAVAEGKSARFEAHHPQSEAWYSVRAYPSESGISVYLQDITERKRAEERIRFQAQLLEAVGQAVIATDPQGRIVYWNKAAEEMYGWSAEEVMGHALRELAVSEDLLEQAEEIRSDLMAGRPWSGEFVVRRRDGTPFWVLGVATPFLDELGNLAGMIGVSTDITERKEAEEEKSRQARHAALRADVSTSLAEGGTLQSILQHCTECMVLHLDAAFARIWTLNEEENVLELQASAGMYTHLDGTHSLVPVGELKIGLIAQERLPHLTNTVLNDPRISDKEWAKRESMVAFAGYPLIVEDRLVGVMAMFARKALEDDTIEALASVADAIAQGIQRKWAEEQLQHQASHDLLTGLPNRYLLVDRLKQAFRRTSRRSGHKVAVLFVDLDGFKAVNDSLGHEVGDKLLAAVSERLRGCIRLEDTLARIGGDEFILLLEEVEDPDGALWVTERLTEEFRVPFHLNGRELFVRISIGVALGTSRQKSAEDLLRDADTAMYRAKAEGIDYLMFDPQMYLQAVNRLELENDIRRAIEVEEFALHFQPIVNLESGDVRGVEALVRWNHPERGLLDPEEFVPVAEESGLIIPVGEQVLEEACRQAKRWQEEHPRIPPLIMSVNVSARQLRRPDLATTVEEVLQRTGFEASCLSLDITETVYVKVLEGNTAALDELKRLGVRIAIDDFGVGYSSLSYLKRLPADVLKIDKSFTKGIGEEVEDTAIVRMIIELAHTLGMEVIAEGVEDRTQAALLREMGCDMAQGFFFSKPLPPEEASEFLAERAS